METQEVFERKNFDHEVKLGRKRVCHGIGFGKVKLKLNWEIKGGRKEW